MLVGLMGSEPATLAGKVRPGYHRPRLAELPLEVLTTMAAERADLYATVADGVIDDGHVDPDQTAQATLEAIPGARGA